MSEKFQYDKYHFEKLDDEPFLIFTAYNSYSMAEDAEESVKVTFDLLNHINEPIYYILDWQDIDPLNMEDVSVGAMSVALSQNPLFKHPKFLGIGFVTSSEILAMAAKGLDSELYGHIKIEIFDSVDDAVNFFRQ